MVENKKKKIEKSDTDKIKAEKERLNDLDYLDWIFNHGWQRVKKGGFG